MNLRTCAVCDILKNEKEICKLKYRIHFIVDAEID